jgi:hypothetical protein
MDLWQLYKQACNVLLPHATVMAAKQTGKYGSLRHSIIF